MNGNNIYRVCVFIIVANDWLEFFFAFFVSSFCGSMRTHMYICVFIMIVCKYMLWGYVYSVCSGLYRIRSNRSRLENSSTWIPSIFSTKQSTKNERKRSFYTTKNHTTCSMTAAFYILLFFLFSSQLVFSASIFTQIFSIITYWSIMSHLLSIFYFMISFRYHSYKFILNDEFFFKANRWSQINDIRWKKKEKKSVRPLNDYFG